MSKLRKFTLGLALVLAVGAGCRPGIHLPVSYCPTTVEPGTWVEPGTTPTTAQGFHGHGTWSHHLPACQTH